MRFKMSPDVRFAYDETLRVMSKVYTGHEEEYERLVEMLNTAKDEEELIQYLINPINVYFDPGKEPSRRLMDEIIKEEGIILTEKVHLPHIHKNKDNVGVLSMKELTIMPFYVRANQQISLKEGKSARESSTRNIAGQVTGKTARAGSLTDSEIALFVGNNTPNIMRELLGPASHDLVAKRQMKQSIIRTGNASLKDLSDESGNKKSLVYFSEVLKAYDLDNDLVEPIVKR